MKKKKKVFALILSLLLSGGLLGGCSSGGDYNSMGNKGTVMDSNPKEDYYGEYEGENGFTWNEHEQSDQTKNPNTGSDISSDAEEYLKTQKLVYTCEVFLETLEFQKTVDSINDAVSKAGGFVESNNVTDSAGLLYDQTKTRGTLYASMTVRIPTKNYKSFLDGLAGYGKVTDKTENVRNVTKQYHDTQTTIEVLEKEQRMLLDMMDKAESIPDMIEIEQRLAVVQQQLALYKSDLSALNVDIDFSTITIRVEEVVKYEMKLDETTYLERLAAAFTDSMSSFGQFLEGFSIWLIYVAPYVIVFGSITAIILSVTRKKRKEKASVKAKQLLPPHGFVYKSDRQMQKIENGGTSPASCRQTEEKAEKESEEKTE